MKLPLAARAILIALMLFAFYTAGVSIEVIAVLAVIFGALILLRERIWKAAERAVEKYFPFTKAWPEWAEKAMIIAVFIAGYLILKSAIYFLFGLAGIDIEQLILSAFEKSFAISASNP